MDNYILHAYILTEMLRCWCRLIDLGWHLLDLRAALAKYIRVKLFNPEMMLIDMSAHSSSSHGTPEKIRSQYVTIFLEMGVSNEIGLYKTKYNGCCCNRMNNRKRRPNRTEWQPQWHRKLKWRPSWPSIANCEWFNFYIIIRPNYNTVNMILRLRAIVWRVETLTSGTDVDESAPYPVSYDVVIDVNKITDSRVQYQSC
jgi:hypothetical protein